MPESSEPQEPQNPPETPAPPPVEYAKAEDFKRLEQVISGQQELIASLNASLQQAIRAQQQPPARPASGDDFTDEQLDTMLDEGRITRAQHARMIAKRELATFKTAEVDPIRATGIGAISATTKQLALSMRDDNGQPLLPHYKKYQKEIDDMVATLPAESRLSPDVYVQAHALVVGKHIGEIIEETREATIRAANAPPPEHPAPTTRTGRNTRTDQVPTVEELMGRDAATALEAKGLTPDQIAKRLGHADWKTYAKLAEAQATGAA